MSTSTTADHELSHAPAALRAAPATMTMRRRFLVLVPALLLCAYAAPAEADDLKCGPQAGDIVPGPLYSLVAYSAEPGQAGKKTDFFEQYGGNPVVLVFARELSLPVTSLIRELDEEVAKRKSARLRASIIFLSDDEALEQKLKDFGEKRAIKHVPLAIMEPEGPKRYRVSKEAAVTVVLYRSLKVAANHPFRKGALNEAGLEKILADVPKITSTR